MHFLSQFSNFSIQCPGILIEKINLILEVILLAISQQRSNEFGEGGMSFGSSLISLKLGFKIFLQIKKIYKINGFSSKNVDSIIKRVVNQFH